MGFQTFDVEVENQSRELPTRELWSRHEIISNRLRITAERKVDAFRPPERTRTESY